MAPKRHCHQWEENGIDEKQEKRWWGIISDFMSVFGELSLGVMLRLVAIWWSVTKQEDFDSETLIHFNGRK